MAQINYQTGVFKTIASYQTPKNMQQACNDLCNAIVRSNYKIIQQNHNTVIFKTPMSLTDWGFKMTAYLNQCGAGTVVRIEGKSVIPISFDILGVCKKKIEVLTPYV